MKNFEKKFFSDFNFYVFFCFKIYFVPGFGFPKLIIVLIKIYSFLKYFIRKGVKLVQGEQIYTM